MGNCDDVYTERNKCIALLAAMAHELGLTVGLRQSSDFEPGWQKCIVIDLPSGQVTWHLKDEELAWFPYPEYPGEWDGHDTSEKYQRVLAMCERGNSWLRLAT